ncbi:MAG: TetR family transcriptional regulator [Deltaproteobacteria bacterium]|nr:TetR family transcriptional regulator [Deltaproteobacteria bacterium]
MKPNDPTKVKTGTREALLDSAEVLFSDLGIAGTSLRAVTSHAGANLAAVNYHFVSKEGLVREVFRRRLAPVSAERLRLLDLARGESAPEAAPVAVIVEAFVAPVLRMGEDQPEKTRNFKRLLGRTLSEPGDEMSKIVMEQFREVGERFLKAFQEALPGVPLDILMWRFHFMVGSLIQVTLNGALIERHTAGRCDASNIPELTARLVESLAAAFEASVSGFRSPPKAARSSQGNAAEISPERRKQAESHQQPDGDSSSIFPWEEGF